MLPEVILDIIQEYVTSMDEYTDLPPLLSVRRLMDRCDRFVIQQLGVVLGMPSNEVDRLRFRLEMRGEFVFYFHMSVTQRFHLLEVLQGACESDRHISCMTWIYVEKTPKLIHLEPYRKIFRDGLFCRLMEYLITETPTQAPNLI